MSGFGVTPPWYGDDEIAFNAYAIASEKRRDALRRLGVAIRLQPNKRDGNCSECPLRRDPRLHP